MEPVLYLMAILGCSDAELQCEAVRTPPARYATVDACQAAAPQALIENSDVAFPVVTAQCQRAGTALAANTARPRG